MPGYAILVKRLGREPSDMFEGSIPSLGTILRSELCGVYGQKLSVKELVIVTQNQIVSHGLELF